MPRRGDYSKCKIYKITSLSEPDLVYYGHTCVALSQRFAIHRAPSNKCRSKLIIDKGDAVIMLVENFPCTCDDEASAREKYYIINNVCVNKNIPTRTREEYRQDNLEIIKEKMKIYQATNKDKMKTYIKKYHEKYYAEFHKCECGSKYTLNNICHHKQTKKHIKFMQEKATVAPLEVIEEEIKYDDAIETLNNEIVRLTMTEEERKIINDLFPLLEELNDDTISVLLPDFQENKK